MNIHKNNVNVLKYMEIQTKQWQMMNICECLKMGMQTDKDHNNLWLPVDIQPSGHPVIKSPSSGGRRQRR